MNQRNVVTKMEVCSQCWRTRKCTETHMPFKYDHQTQRIGDRYYQPKGWVCGRRKCKKSLEAGILMSDPRREEELPELTRRYVFMLQVKRLVFRFRSRK